MARQDGNSVAASSRYEAGQQSITEKSEKYNIGDSGKMGKKKRDLK